MEVLRTPSERFEDLPGYDHEPSFVDVGHAQPADGEVRMAYVDEGGGPETFLCLHGEPTWSYLYRTMIPTLSERGRVVVPDFVGFGRSDKYDDPDAYGFGQHYDALVAFIEDLDLTDVTLVCQDWGGILGLRAAAEHPDRFARIVPMNTGVPDGTQEMPEVWHEFRRMVREVDRLDVGRLVDQGCIAALDDEVRAAYDAPFPEERYKAGARAWPDLVPTDPDDEGAAAMRETKAALADWEKPAFVLFSDADPIMSRNRDPLREHIPTATDQPDIRIEDASHFLQEDAGEVVAEEIVDFVDRT